MIVRVDPPEHHLVEIRLDGRASYLLWVSGEDQDAVLADGDVAVAFPEPALALRYAAEQSLPVRSEVPTAFDLDEVAAWLRTDDVPDPVVVLNAWNIFWDVATGTGRPLGHRSRDQDRVYDKLFWANNLPAVTPEGMTYTPEWTEDELQSLRKVVEDGISLVRSALRDERAH